MKLHSGVPYSLNSVRSFLNCQTALLFFVPLRALGADAVKFQMVPCYLIACCLGKRFFQDVKRAPVNGYQLPAACTRQIMAVAAVI